MPYYIDILDIQNTLAAFSEILSLSVDRHIDLWSKGKSATLKTRRRKNTEIKASQQVLLPSHGSVSVLQSLIFICQVITQISWPDVAQKGQTCMFLFH